MDFDVLEIRRGLECVIIPVQLAQPSMHRITQTIDRLVTPLRLEDIRISRVNGRVPISDRTQVAFKLPNVHWIKANLRGG